MKDIEESLKSVNFSKLSKIKEKLLLEILEKRNLENLDETNELDFEELDQVVAAKDREWFNRINESTNNLKPNQKLKQPKFF